jgi:hypothetical protein
MRHSLQRSGALCAGSFLNFRTAPVVRNDAGCELHTGSWFNHHGPGPYAFARIHPYRVWPGSRPCWAYCSLNFDMLSAV